jgi:hypothetical protein
MLLKLKTYDGQFIEIEIHHKDTMRRIKELVYQEAGIPPYRQRLFWKGRGVHNMNKTAETLGLTGGSVLHLVLVTTGVVF